MYIPQNMVINCEAYSNRDGSIPIPCPKTDHQSRGLTRKSDKVWLAPNFFGWIMMDHDGSICSSTSNLRGLQNTAPAGCLGGSSAEDWWRHSWMMNGKHSMVNGGFIAERITYDPDFAEDGSGFSSWFVHYQCSTNVPLLMVQYSCSTTLSIHY